MFKLLVIINKLGLPAIDSQIIEFEFLEEAEKAADCIDERSTDFINFIVIKLY